MLNPATLLKQQGWLGHGHALHPSGRGVRKPILTSRKQNTLGLGKKRVDVHADQWWARAFDAGLKDLDLDLDVTAGVVRVEGGEKGKGKGKGVVKKEDNSMVVELRALADGRGGKWLGLYNGFVRGEGLSGTFEEVVRDEVVEMEGVDEKKKKRKRKKGEVDDVVDVAIGMERGGPSKKYRPKSVDESLIRHDEQVKKKKKKQKKSRHMKELASNG